MGSILSLLSSLARSGQSNPAGTLGAPQRDEAPSDDDSTSGSWSQSRGHQDHDDD